MFGFALKANPIHFFFPMILYFFAYADSRFFSCDKNRKIEKGMTQNSIFLLRFPQESKNRFIFDPLVIFSVIPTFFKIAKKKCNVREVSHARVRLMVINDVWVVPLEGL